MEPLIQTVKYCLTVLLCSCLVLSLTACGGDMDTESEPSADSFSAGETVSNQKADTEPGTEENGQDVEKPDDVSRKKTNDPEEKASETAVETSEKSQNSDGPNAGKEVVIPVPNESRKTGSDSSDGKKQDGNGTSAHDASGGASQAAGGQTNPSSPSDKSCDTQKPIEEDASGIVLPNIDI